MNIAIKLNDLTVAYNRYAAVHHIKGEFKSGELTAIAGPNGAGKSTLLKAIAGIIPVHEGSIELCNFTRYEMSYLPQASSLEIDFPINILEMICSGFWSESGGFKNITNIQKEKAKEALEIVGLSGFDGRTIDTLSVGQLQRALFARILVKDSKVILLDEPFAAIDTDTTEALLAVIKKWHKEERTVICVLHDFEQIKANFNQCLLISRECIAWGKSNEVLSSENLFSSRFLRQASRV